MRPEIVCDTVSGSAAPLKTRGLDGINWCLAPITASWVIVCDTIFRGMELGSETVFDTVFGGDRLLKTRGLVANNWCLAPIIWGEGNCV